MRHKTSLWERLSPFFRIVLYVAITFIWLMILRRPTRLPGQAPDTLWLLFWLVACFFIQSIFHYLYSFFTAFLCGGKVLAYRFASGSFVRENRHYYSRELLSENLFLPSIVFLKKRTPFRTALTFVSASFMQLLSGALIAVMLGLGLFSSQGPIGAFLIAFSFTSLWTALYSILPLYIGDIPSPGLLALQILSSKSILEEWNQTLDILRAFSESNALDPSLYTEAKIREITRIGSDIDQESLSPFRLLFLLRYAELAFCLGYAELSDHLLAELYFHREEFPERVLADLTTRVIFTLSCQPHSAQHDTADLIMNDRQREQFKKDHAFSSLFALFSWTSTHPEMKGLLPDLYQKLLRQYKNIPYAFPRHSYHLCIDEFYEKAAL